MSRIETTKEQIREVVALNNNFPFGMLMGAVVVMAAGSIECNELCGAPERFTVVTSVFMTVAVLAYIFMLYNGSLSEGGETWFSFGFFISWGVIVGVTTFEDPFVDVVGNGFVAAWLGFISSVGNLVYNVQFASVMKDRFVNQGLTICLLVVGSVVVVVAALTDDGCCDGEEVLAIVGGAVSLVFLAIRIYTGETFQQVFGIFIALWWGIIGTILTFSTFKEIGNGFIAAWVCVIASAGMLRKPSNSGTDWNAKYNAGPDATFVPQQTPAEPDVGQMQAGNDIEKMF